MKVVVLLSLFFVAAWAFPKGQNEPQYKRLYVDPKTEGLPKDVIPRITGGEEAAPHSIPFQAYLIISTNSTGRWLCGGSLISPRHVLTAAHCLEDGISVAVYLGVHSIRPPDSSIVLAQSHTLIIHEEYDGDEISNDIGLIVLDTPVEFNANISAVALPSNEIENDYEGANARVSGWGLTEGDGDTSPVLLQANATVISNWLCDLIYGIVIDSQLCTIGDDAQGTCSGDSGGPLVAGNVQIGIVSYGAVGCPAGYPSAFTRVTSFLDWIEEKSGLDL